MMQTRRRFLSAVSLASAAGLLRAPLLLAAEGALETTTVRIAKLGAACLAPQFVAEELLRTEGFTDVRYVDTPPAAIGLAIGLAIGRGEVDFSTAFAIDSIQAIDGGAPVVVLAGVHIGCYELLASEAIRSIRELKGKSVGLQGSPPNLLTLMASHVGLNPTRDIRWVTSTDPSVKPLELFAEGKIDAFLGFAPEPQELRARHVGHVIVNSAVDRPWSEYFCCMLTGNREYVREYPVATKRVLRAILKAADLCASQPARVAQTIVDRGFISQYEYARQTLSELPYDKWREYDAEDTIRFYALRLHEAGLIKSTPNKIIAENTDWRFFDELKRELKT
jgi:NitT/TauT family transport system substrate-binding protein